MSVERIRLNGMQSRALELGAKKPSRSTPTKDSEVVVARAYRGLMEAATFHTMRLEGSGGTPEQLEASQEALRAIRGDIVRAGHILPVFDMVVKDNVTLEKKKAKDEADDARLVEETFSEHQAFRGEVPIVNFGNHAFRK